MAPPPPGYLLAWLNGYLTGVARGREDLTAEQNGETPPERVYTFGQWADQVDARRAWDAQVAAEVAEAGR